MGENLPSKDDLQLVFKRLRSLPANKVCFDCNAKNPTWATVTYGVFICIDCSAVHRSLGVHLTFVRSTQLDTNWTWLQLRQMQVGGNANGTTFFQQHNCTSTDAQQKYNSRAASLYREKLSQMAIKAMKVHGTKLLIETIPEPLAETKPDADFFEDHVSFESMLHHEAPLEPSSQVNKEPSTVAALNIGQPNVDAALSWGDAETTQQRKPTIGGRKPPAKKAGMGAKKGGLGATKVKANFAEIEQQAAMADQLKVTAAEEAKVAAAQTAEEEQNQMASMRLAYQDLSLQQKREEDKMKQFDPKKAKQIERLGMGFASRSGVSHSALSDMKTIEQEGSSNQPKSSVFDRRDNEGFFEDYVYITPGMSMSREKGLEGMFYGEGNTSRDRHSTNVGTRAVSGGWGEETASRPAGGGGAVSGGWGWEEESKQKEKPSPRRETQPSASAPSVTLTNEAQTKFGGAKAISSQQFFGDTEGNTWERKANLSRFEGSNSISSSDYFNNGATSPSRGGGGGGSMNMNTPDLDDVKESVRQGVTKVAGKLSSLANGVMSSIQDRYGY